MADPLFDQIDATTLANLRDEIVYDNFFKDSPLLSKLRAPNTNRRKIIKRLLGLDIGLERAQEIAEEMVQAGIIKDPDVEIPSVLHVSDIGKWDGNLGIGGDVISEPILYSHEQDKNPTE